MTRPQWRSWREALADWVPVSIALGCLAALVAGYGLPGTSRPEDWLTFGPQVGAMVSLLFLRRFPLAILLVSTVAAITMTLAQWSSHGWLVPVEPTRWIPLAAPFAVYTTIVHSVHRRRTWLLVGLLTALAARPWQPQLTTFTTGVLLTGVPALVGLYVAARKRLVQILIDRVERERFLLTQQARADERARLAGEMYDVVTHRISLMVLQAGALRMTSRDEAIRSAAESLRAAGCQALGELRDLVGVLRTVQPVGSRPAAPADSMPDLATLVAEFDSGGDPVELVEDGNPLLASPIVGRTAYLVVQEALANVRTHAPGSKVCVHVHYGAEQVRLTVRNTAPACGTIPVRTTLGTGLLSLRLRVELVSGNLHAGPHPAGGFTVDATLPAFVPSSDGRVPNRCPASATEHAVPAPLPRQRPSRR